MDPKNIQNSGEGQDDVISSMTMDKNADDNILNNNNHERKFTDMI